MRDVTVETAAGSVLSIDFNAEAGPKGDFVPVRGVELLRVTSKSSNYGVEIRGLKQSTIEDVRVVDCTFDGVKNGNAIERAAAVRFQNTHINGQLTTSGAPA